MFVSKLSVHPILVDKPSGVFKSSSSNDGDCYYQYKTCVRQNKSNGLIVYHHDGVNNEWHFKDTNKLLQACKLERENLILIAKLGISVFPSHDIRKQFEMVKNLCQVEYLDVIIFEADAVTFENNYQNLNTALSYAETLCSSNMLHCYGMNINVAPYCYHNPSTQVAGRFASVPMAFELEAIKELKYLDVFMYPISPTTSIPATYPMLDPNLNEEDITPELKGMEDTRTLTRIAQDPLTCYYGGGSDARIEKNTMKKILKSYFSESKISTSESPHRYENMSENDEDSRLNKVNKILEDLVRRISDGKVDKDYFIESFRKVNEEISLLKQQVHNENDSNQSNVINSDPRDNLLNVIEELEGSLSILETEFLNISEKANYANDDTGDASLVTPSFNTSSSSSHDESKSREIKAISNRKDAVFLISGKYSEKNEESLKKLLDQLCPNLATSSRLQDKALRSVFSVGVDAVSINCDVYASMRKLALKPSDFITASQTDRLFRSFSVPKNII